MFDMGSVVSGDVGNNSQYPNSRRVSSPENAEAKLSFVPSKPAGPAFSSTVNTPPPTVVPVALPVTVEFRPAPEITPTFQHGASASASSSSPLVPSSAALKSSASIASESSSYTTEETKSRLSVAQTQQALDKHTSAVDKLFHNLPSSSGASIEALQQALNDLQKSRESVADIEFSFIPRIRTAQQKLSDLQKLRQAAETLAANETQTTAKQRELDLSQSHLDRLRIVVTSTNISDSSSASATTGTSSPLQSSNEGSEQLSEKQQQQIEYQIHVSTRAIATLSTEIESLQSQRTNLLKQRLVAQAASTTLDAIALRIQLLQTHLEVLEHIRAQELNPIVIALDNLDDQLQKAIHQRKAAN